MGYSLEQFASECSSILKADPGPAGREQVRALLEKVLVDADFVAAHLGPDNTEARKVLYEDPDLGFCICAHVHLGPKASPPHDHGPTWAIYGQAKGVTTMSEWRKVKPAAGDEPGQVALEKRYDMEPGAAVVYNEGVLHSPKRDGETRLIRIEGKNITTVKRDSYVEAA
jgi:predicted metal-dependent enzyme (double-stranded beta helix superfamily)